MSSVKKHPVVRKSFHIDINLPKGLREQEYRVQELPGPGEHSPQSTPQPSPVVPSPSSLRITLALGGLAALIFVVALVASLGTSHSSNSSPMAYMDTTAVVAEIVKVDTANADAPSQRMGGNKRHQKQSEEETKSLLREAQEAYGASDYSKALQLFEQAASAGNSHAEFQLGYMHLKGLGTGTDYEVAVRWFRKAATRGNGEAMRFLGELYYNGDGVPADPKMARSWYRKASKYGDGDAKQALEAMDED